MNSNERAVPTTKWEIELGVTDADAGVIYVISEDGEIIYAGEASNPKDVIAASLIAAAPEMFNELRGSEDRIVTLMKKIRGEK